MGRVGGRPERTLSFGSISTVPVTCKQRSSRSASGNRLQSLTCSCHDLFCTADQESARVCRSAACTKWRRGRCMRTRICTGEQETEEAIEPVPVPPASFSSYPHITWLREQLIQNLKWRSYSRLDIVSMLISCRLPNSCEHPNGNRGGVPNVTCRGSNRVWVGTQGGRTAIERLLGSVNEVSRARAPPNHRKTRKTRRGSGRWALSAAPHSSGPVGPGAITR